MDTTATGLAATSPLELLLCLALLLIVLLPRFNQWPATNAATLAGKPRDYIHGGRFMAFASIYIASFLVFVTVLRMVPALADLLTDAAISAQMAGLQDGSLIKLVAEKGLLATTATALLALHVSQIAAIDNQWRTSLLELARVPLEAINLRDRIRQQLPLLDIADDACEATLTRISEHNPNFNWRALATLPKNDPQAHNGLPLLRALHLVHCIRSFELGELDSQTVSTLDLRLEEIAAMLPTRIAENDAGALKDYRTDIDSITRTLTEILARLCVRYFASEEQHKAKLREFGFRLKFSDQIGANILIPSLLCLLIVSMVTLLTLMPALHAFDLLNIPTPESRNLTLANTTDAASILWFNPQRIMNWGGGAVLSYGIAIAIGIIMGTVLKNESRTIGLPGIILAVSAATLGSCVYFFFYSQGAGSTTLKPHLFWLALGFGFMAMVVINSLNEDVVDAEHVRKRAMTMALQYGLICVALSALLQLSNYLQGTRSFQWDHLVAFATFGFIRGFLLAFLVSLVIMGYVHQHINGARRRQPRFRFRQSLQGQNAGMPVRFFIKDISESGAKLLLNAATDVQPGAEVTLQFEMGPLNGKVVWVQEKRAGIRFSKDQPLVMQWQSFIRQNQAWAA